MLQNNITEGNRILILLQQYFIFNKNGYLTESLQLALFNQYIKDLKFCPHDFSGYGMI